MTFKKPADQEGQRTDQTEELSASDREFDAKYAEFISRLPERLLWVLLIVLGAETLQELHSTRISSRVETVLVGQPMTGQAFATPISETPHPRLIPITTQVVDTTEQLRQQYNFQIGQRVQILDKANQPHGVISDIAYFNGAEGSRLSFIIVDFPDGTWGGFNPDQVSVIADAAAILTPETSP